MRITYVKIQMTYRLLKILDYHLLIKKKLIGNKNNFNSLKIGQ